MVIKILITALGISFISWIVSLIVMRAKVNPIVSINTNLMTLKEAKILLWNAASMGGIIFSFIGIIITLIIGLWV
jgi:hypothetical protein